VCECECEWGGGCGGGGVGGGVWGVGGWGGGGGAHLRYDTQICCKIKDMVRSNNTDNRYQYYKFSSKNFEFKLIMSTKYH